MNFLKMLTLSYNKHILSSPYKFAVLIGISLQTSYNDQSIIGGTLELFPQNIVS